MADNPSTPIYEGGIPNQGFNGTFPNSVGGQSMFQPDPTAGEVDTQAGGPATFSGSSDPGVISGAEYQGPGRMNAGSMNMRNLDDIKNSV